MKERGNIHSRGGARGGKGKIGKIREGRGRETRGGKSSEMKIGGRVGLKNIFIQEKREGEEEK